MSLFQELKRRNVFCVAAANIIVSWLLLQVSETLVPAQHLPEWFHSGVAFVLIMGFPIALILAWAYEITREGLKKERDVAEQLVAIRALPDMGEYDLRSSSKRSSFTK